MGDDGQFPVYRLEVQLHDDPKKAKVCFPYFSGICDWVKELTLNVDIDMDIYVKSRIRMDTRTFPKNCIYKDLTHLNLRLYEKTPRSSEFWKEFIDFVQNIMKNSAHLREVNVVYLSFNGHKVPICTVIEDLFPSSNSAGISKLRCINLDEVPLDKINLTKWSTLNLKLRKLEITLSSLSSDLSAQLGKFLKTQTGTLKELTLNLDHCESLRPVAPTPTFTFPRMEKLEQLRFEETFLNFPVVTFLGIDFARQLPCLKKLVLDSDGVDWGDLLGNSLLAPTNTVEELILPRYLLTPVPVVAAARVFPSLRKLEIPARTFLTQPVYEKMPNLEVLSLININGHGVDRLVTGLDFNVCSRFVMECVLRDKWIERLKTAEGRSMGHGPWLVFKLKTLKLSTDGYDWKLRYFSRLSFHVFKQMSTLKCLDLNGWPDRDRSGRYYTYNDETQRQFLAALRQNFVVL